MAVAAFKSTTRRTCDIRGVEVDMPATPRSRNTSPVRRSRPSSPVRRMPSTPRSRPTSPTKHQQPAKQQNERMHRRTRSFADLSSSSPHHFTDPSSMTAAAAPETPRSRASLGLRSSAHHLLPSDSESEVEPRYMRWTESRRDSSDNESVHSAREFVQRNNGHGKHSSRQTVASLRRSMSQLELSQPTTPVYYRKGNVPGEDPLRREDGEVHVEEKTIRAVHTQTKVQTLCYNCLYDVSSSAEVSTDVASTGGLKANKVQANTMEPPSGETDAINVHSAMRAEVRQAVAEALHELEQSVGKDLQGHSLSGNNKFQGISNDVRKEYADKLEQSERKVQELLSQLAVEERRCLDLVKLVKDLILHEQEALQAQRRSSAIFKDDRDIMRKSLDEEAQRYFEECVSIAKLESIGADSIMASQEKDILSTENEEPFDWPVETDSDSMFCHDDMQQVTQREDHTRKLSSQDFSEALLVGKSGGKTKDCAPLGDEGMLLPWLDWEPEVDTLNRKERVEKAAVDFREWKKAWARKSMEWGKSMKRERGKDEGAVNVDEFLFERVRLWQRIIHGRVIVCGGKR